MKILVLNCGSSSIKYKLFEMNTKEELTQGGIEKIGLEGSFLKFVAPNGEKVTLQKDIAEHTAGIEFILETLVHEKYGCIKSMDEINAVGHRVVHGGEKFNSSVLLTDDVLKMVEDCIDIAPLHNPANLKGIAAIENILPGIPQVGVFDTAFHQTMPKHAYMYPLPYELYEKYAIRRYGFHGTSHRYVSKRACEFLDIDYHNSKVITAHLGNGGSIAAIENGKSIDTSMGMTPVEGLMMGTRVGDLDLGVATFVMNKENMDIKEFADLINKKSGLAGISGVSSDMRDIEDAIAAGNERAKLATEMFDYHVVKYIGSYAAVLNGVDTLVFTGGIGENDTRVREKVCKSLTYLGIELDEKFNSGLRGKEAIISTPNSKVKVVVIPTDEELMIATDTLEIVTGQKLS